ncbi:MAG TPA: hypothetical protein VFW96_11665, partial [Thermomicrobiales bacterium]|nr:hypothetical protein [Thermomicrobiales bacterium]
GLLYHLPRPWELLDRIARASDRLFLSTHYALADEASVTVRGLRGRMYREYGVDDPLSGLSPESFWPTLDSLDAMLRAAGFTSIRVISDDPAFANGPVVGLAATAGRGRLRRVAARLPARLGRRR